MAKTLSWTGLGAALFFCAGFVLGHYQGGLTEQANRAKIKAEAMFRCERTESGTAYVAERFGAWHCFFRTSQYPYRVKYSTLVMETDETSISKK